MINAPFAESSHLRSSSPFVESSLLRASWGGGLPPPPNPPADFQNVYRDHPLLNHHFFDHHHPLFITSSNIMGGRQPPPQPPLLICRMLTELNAAPLVESSLPRNAWRYLSLLCRPRASCSEYLHNTMVVQIEEGRGSLPGALCPGQTPRRSLHRSAHG